MYKRCVSETTKKLVAASQSWKCNVCKRMLSAFWETDHVVALWRGGSNEISNLQALCRECHAAKGAAERLAHQPLLSVDTEPAHADGCQSTKMFNAMFEPWSGGAFPLAVAKHMCAMRFGAAFDERRVAVEVAPHMVYPPSYASFFANAGMAPQAEGPVLQAVRMRRKAAKQSTRSTHS
jgi:hypothetical protein